MENDHDPVAYAGKQPTVSELKQELDLCLRDYGNNLQALDDIRFCRWPDQAPDGRKKDRNERKAFPWHNASDSRPYTIDGIIGYRVALLVTSFFRAMVKPKAADDEIGEYAVTLADYFINEVLFEELVREVELSAQYREHYGWTVLHPIWEQRTALKRRKLTIQQLLEFAATQQQYHPELPLSDLGVMIMDPLQEDVAIEVAAALFDLYAAAEFARTAGNGTELELPSLSRQSARRAVREMRETGKATVRVPYVCRNEPRIYALRPWDEIILPPDTSDIESARIIQQREYLTEAELRARGRDEGWNPEWIEAAAKQKGRTASAFFGLPTGAGDGTALRQVAGATSGPQAITDGVDFIEIYHAVYRAVDEDDVQGIYCTTYHPAILKDDNNQELIGKRELIDYPHGQYPYVAGAQEHTCRCIAASRGVTEIAHTDQNNAKVLDDAVIDRTSITVMPPVNVPVGLSNPLGVKYKFGPAVQNPTQPGREPQFMQMPAASGFQEGLATADRIERKLAIRFGVPHATVPPQHTQLVQGLVTGGFLLMWSKAIQQIVALAQQYMPDLEFARVTGAPQGWLDAHRDRSGILAAELTFDVRDLDPELVSQRIEAMNKVVIPSDVSGVLNRTKWVEIQVRTINPSWAKELIMPQAAASQQLYQQVLSDVANMFLGTEAQYVKDDPTAGTKLQYVQQIVAGNPNYQTALQQEGRFAELLQNYVKNLTFSLTQERNKQVGRIGVQPMTP